MPEDLLIGGGELYFLFDDDDDGWKHLGNAEDFTITTTLDSIEKYGSMNKKRELQARNTTQASVTATATLNEYDVKNLASALFGEFDKKHQVGRIVTDQVYTVNTVPGLITVIDEDYKRYYGISEVVVAPRTSLLEGVYWLDSKTFGDISTVDNYHDTVIVNSMGGVIKIDRANTNIAQKFDIWVCVEKAPDAPGDLLGMKVQIFETIGGGAVYKTFENSALSETIILGSGIEVTFTLTGSSTFSQMGLSPTNGIRAVAVPQAVEYIKDLDYVVNDQSCRAGIIKIPPGSRIQPGDEVVVSCIVPDRNLDIIAGGSRKEHTGQLLFVADNAAGPNYVIEGWRVHIKPEGDLTGLISSGDFGSYRLEFMFLTDYEYHPGSPYYQVTLVDYGSLGLGNNTYNPKY